MLIAGYNPWILVPAILVAGFYTYSVGFEGGAGGKKCSIEAYADICKNSKRGYCNENIMLAVLNCHARSRAKFTNIDGNMPGYEWLRGFQGKLVKSYEIDAYNPELKLAFEYNGPQHYANIYGDKAFQNTVNNMYAKKQLCENRGIKMITVPPSIRGPEQMRNYIISRLDDEKVLRGFRYIKYKYVPAVPEPKIVDRPAQKKTWIVK